MDKFDNAKAAQGYTTEKQNCGNCGAMEFDMDFCGWYKRRVEKEGPESHYNRDCYKEPCRHRCGLGGFAVKMTATCQQWRAKEPDTSPNSRQEV